MFMQRWKTTKYTAGQNSIIINTPSLDPPRGPKSVIKLLQVEFIVLPAKMHLFFWWLFRGRCQW